MPCHNCRQRLDLDLHLHQLPGQGIVAQPQALDHCITLCSRSLTLRQGSRPGRRTPCHPMCTSCYAISVVPTRHFPLGASSQAGCSAPDTPTWDAAVADAALSVVFNTRRCIDTKELCRHLQEINKVLKNQELCRHTLSVSTHDEEAVSRKLSKSRCEEVMSIPRDEGNILDVGVGETRKEDQKSLAVGIVGAPNAGSRHLLISWYTPANFSSHKLNVGTKVAAVSRKTNTTTHEVLGVMTKGNTQVCFFDTPGLRIGHHGYPYRTDIKVRVESAWSSIDLYDLLIVIFDVHRHITKPDTRVINLIKNLGAKAHPKQKRVLCMNKVDLVEDKKDLLKVAKDFEDLPGYERYFMISGLKGSGVKDLVQYLMDQAVKKPWDEEPSIMTEEIMKTISLEVVREKLLNYVHQEIPYMVEHRLMDWKEQRDGSLRVEQHFITPKLSQRKILVGKNGSKIGRIGIEANDELRSIFKREVHLILRVSVARKKSA
ncbi:GTP-binding protein ERG [Platanthera guangdongensis]|uniref:GTP-binding protein ERG n=1 Tax=Platanthera guangdongensis TaxID=2320717 RepID=A0ABR2MEU2_9ASPA